MARVHVLLPALLGAVLEGERALEVEAKTLEGALAELLRLRPGLGVHLFDEAGALRPHVLCFHNGRNTRWMPDLALPVAEGDEIRILQAVSGG